MKEMKGDDCNMRAVENFLFNALPSRDRKTLCQNTQKCDYLRYCHYDYFNKS